MLAITLLYSGLRVTAADDIAPVAEVEEVTPDLRLFVVYPTVEIGREGHRIVEDRIVEILPDGTTGTTVRIPLEKPFIGFFTTTVRAGSPPSWTLEMLGQREGVPNTISYARVNMARRTTSRSQP